MTSILGISGYYHDAAAAILVDGEVIAAAQEERFSRQKHDASFPVQAIRYCLAEAGITADQLDHVGFYEKPFLKLERFLESLLTVAPSGRRPFLSSMPGWLTEKSRVARALNKALDVKFPRRLVYCEHHQSHAASAFFPSPFTEAAILTVDGVGEWATATRGIGSGNRIELTEELRFPHSLGLLYSAMTYFTGFKVDSGEYKLMGLAPYGMPRYVDLILEKLIDLKDDGSFRLDLSYFGFLRGMTMTGTSMEKLFGRPRRSPEAEITQSDMDIAASIQKVTELVLVRMTRHLQEQTGMTNLCMAGGVALNCVANRRILEASGFEQLWIQPAAGDAGGALGVAWLIWHQLLNRDRPSPPVDRQSGSLLGPKFSADEIEAALGRHQINGRKLDDHQLVDAVAALLADQQIVGWFQGRMEFGPRALGNRSILADARNPEMQSMLNQKIKFRESFRPFAASVLESRVHDFFDVPRNHSSPYMLLVGHVVPAQRNVVPAQVNPMDQLGQLRSSVSAVTHVDYSTRLQTVNRETNPMFFQLIDAFQRKTGCPMLINTSFNVRDEPIVCTPDDAIRCFISTGLDALVIGNYLVVKRENQQVVMSLDRT